MEKIFWGNNKSVERLNLQKFQEFIDLSSSEQMSFLQRDDGFPKHIISSAQFNKEFLEYIFKLSKSLKSLHRGNINYINSLCSGFSVLNYFQQPSSRTFLSFSTAQSLLGISKEEVRSLETSSFVKGESDFDSLRTISSYFDSIVCRHPSDHFHLFAAWVMGNSEREIPIINAGCGTKEHPTQALLDFYTIKESFQGSLDGLRIGFVGDCLRGRTVHSLAKLMANYQNIDFVFISPEKLQIDEGTSGYIKKQSPSSTVTLCSDGIDSHIKDLDVIYMTRIQKERLPDEDEYAKVAGAYKLHANHLSDVKAGMIIMHPLPRVDEIHPSVDATRHARYFEQAFNGVVARMALLCKLLGVKVPADVMKAGGAL